MTLADMERRLADWHREKYGGEPVRVRKALCKLLEELGEFGEALNDGNGYQAAIEAADVVFVLCHLVRSTGFSLATAIRDKLDIIEARLTDDSFGR